MNRSFDLPERPLSDVIKIIGGRWRALIIYFLHNGPLRYRDLDQKLPSISHEMLSLDLRRLEIGGIVARTVADEAPTKAAYKLTAIGVEMSEIVRSLYKWEQKYKPRVTHQRDSKQV